MFKRNRKLRSSTLMRNLVKDVYLTKEDLIYPIFVEEGKNIKTEIASMPGIFRFSMDRIDEELQEIVKLGIKSVLLFGIPKHKDECATSSYDEDGIVQQAIKYIKKNYPEILVIGDVCCCEYTSHGHCGVLDKNGYVKNDETLEILSKIALSYAKVGVDIIAPSDMMDGRIEKINEILEKNGYFDVALMSYAVKYSSAYYGPFRDAADSAPKFGDRKTYQMDFRNSIDALPEVAEDVRQGADMIIVKPALSYSDIMMKVKENFNVPVVAYNVSGEYSMVKAASKNGWIDEEKIVMEQMYGFKRAGATAIITYFAKDVARYLENERN